MMKGRYSLLTNESTTKITQNRRTRIFSKKQQSTIFLKHKKCKQSIFVLFEFSAFLIDKNYKENGGKIQIT